MSKSTSLRKGTIAKPLTQNLPTSTDLLPVFYDDNPVYSNDVNLPQLRS